MTADDGNTFTCWKEIAAYFGKGVRTVQRWETQFGLPVQRPDTRSKGIVRASRKELELWLQMYWSSRAIKTKKLNPAESRDSLVISDDASLQELRARSQELLNRLEECLRMLNTNCDNLRYNLCKQDSDEKRESRAA